MKNICKLTFLGLFILFSFYYTNKVALIVKKSNPMIKQINNIKDKYTIKSVNAKIKDNTIVPGLNGKKVNIDKSFENMNKLGFFNEEYLMFSEIKPKISLNDNIDKIIIKGNDNKNGVSLICDNSDILNFLINSKIKVTTSYKMEEKSNKLLTYINNENTEKRFDDVESILNVKKNNTNICVIDNNNYIICKKYKKYLVMPSKVLNSSNILELKKNIKSGDIIKIKDNAKLSDVKILIKNIYNNNLKIISLDEIINESIIK